MVAYLDNTRFMNPHSLLEPHELYGKEMAAYLVEPILNMTLRIYIVIIIKIIQTLLGAIFILPPSAAASKDVVHRYAEHIGRQEIVFRYYKNRCAYSHSLPNLL